MMNKCLKYDEIFEADPELLDIYIQYLEKTGRVGFMEKVKKYVYKMKLTDYVVEFLTEKRDPGFLWISGNHDRTSGRFH